MNAKGLLVYKNVAAHFITILILTSCAFDHHKSLYKQKPAHYSYIIGNIRNNHVDMEHFSDVYATPASCQKVITALLAYKTLGSSYVYETKLYVLKRNSKIYDIIISFSGDPTLTSEDLIKLLKPLEGKTIPGHIVLDASLYRTPPHSPNIMIDDVGTSYGQPISSMIIDENLVIINVAPGSIGDYARINNDSGYPMDSSVITNLALSNAKVTWRGDAIMAKGNINMNGNSSKIKLSPKKIEDYALYKIKNIMNILKIKGKVKIVNDKSKIPNNLTLLNKGNSKPLGEIIPPALKRSDNLVFDNIYLNIINLQSPEGIEDWGDGNKIIKSLIYKSFGVDVNNALFVDGSGLSRYNRLQPRKLFQILKQGYTNHEFVTALSSPMELNSTLATRNNLPNYIKAKTGSMSGISCLCGYDTRQHAPKAFVVMSSNFSPPLGEIFTITDRFITYHLGR
jgi:D-alanyl-D-alanine carboxypeptidase/D-alanyl-D-alanine-endopeptidase (penicillin-binding protein 4)